MYYFVSIFHLFSFWCFLLFFTIARYFFRRVTREPTRMEGREPSGYLLHFYFYRRGGLRPLRMHRSFNFTAICYTPGHLPFAAAQIPRPCRENLHSVTFRLLGGVPRTSVASVQLAIRANLHDFRAPPEPTELLPAPRRARNHIFGGPKYWNLLLHDLDFCSFGPGSSFSSSLAV